MTVPPISADEALTRDETAALWCVRVSDDSLSEADWTELDLWLTDPANEKAFGDAVAVWHAAGDIAAGPEMIRLRMQTLDRFRRASGRRWKSGFRAPSVRWMGLAAVLCLMLVATLLFLQPAQSFETGVGERRIAMLEDGTRLSLDAGTSVNVDYSQSARSIELEQGRARFNVAHDRTRPFTVTVANKRIVAVGTSFSVERVGDEVRVLLYEGQVDVYDIGEEGTVRRIAARGRPSAGLVQFEPGEEMVLHIQNPEASVSRVDPVRSMTWESGQLNFENDPLSVAAERMNRYSETKIVVDDASTAALPISGVFTAGDVDAMIEGVTNLNRVYVTRRANQIHIASCRSGPCR